VRVLDVACGSGASALPAAEHVGPTGSVLAVDVADRLLARGREKARAAGLENVEFRVGDMLDTRLPSASFDAVVCVFGIFFVPDMTAAVRELWRLVRPGGTLAVTTWGPRWMEPVNDVFWQAVREVRPDLYQGFHPWDRITEAEAVHELLVAAGADTARVVAVPGWHPIASPDDWWNTALGSGLRATVDALDEPDREHVRRTTRAFVADEGIADVEVNVVYASARKLHQTAD
jgi:SAM-dependent methyltransferase